MAWSKWISVVFVAIALIAILSVVVHLTGWGTDHSSDAQTVTKIVAAATTPEAAVRQFLLAEGRHDGATMKALMGSEMLKDIDGWTQSYQHVDFDMSHLRVDSTYPEVGSSQMYPTYYAVRETSVDYGQRNGSETDNAGQQTRFVIVAKETATSPWRVEAVGSGP